MGCLVDISSCVSNFQSCKIFLAIQIKLFVLVEGEGDLWHSSRNKS